MISRSHKQVLLSVLIATVLGGAVVADAAAQARSSDRSGNERRGRDSARAEVLYPEATREEPKAKASSKMGGKLQKLFAAYNKDDFEQTRTLAEEIIAADSANEYDKAVANQLASQAAYNLDDSAAAKQYLEQAVALNQLDNNGHLQALLMLAQLQLQDEQYAEGLANLDKYFAESGSQKPEELVIKGQALYQTEKYAEAIPVLKAAIDASSDPKDNWNQLLMAAYSEAGQTGEAVKEAEALAARNPADKKAQLNLASMYMQADQMDKAAAVMDALRTTGQLTEEREYKQLYSIYANTENKERDVIAVINEGLSNGILKPDYQVYLALAQSYYYSDQIPQAIEAWQNAAPLSKDGETYLNLARVLHSEDRIPEAKQAARDALAKGVRNPADANKIINLK
ncbi:tetratricopeptide repeat protein [Stenotrophomonas mori]|uniref:Tetratricopeptide repeat protein n=1 Tax=Stenotrophomonas mori TaxID=2871096 RepID=A0ABT0SHP6_9GAMM|nr:tetratricopeptide repeat protein [Stenotrophomonas mori]MCL7714855.1 tetratricopeptide repeat protein [Stenotrophomonas mori]